jgi:hypothetical protein
MRAKRVVRPNLRVPPADTRGVPILLIVVEDPQRARAPWALLPAEGGAHLVHKVTGTPGR